MQPYHHEQLRSVIKDVMPYREMVSRLFKDMPTEGQTWLHAAVGVAGECGELLDAVKKHWVYNKPLDMENVCEELGDIRFYYEKLRMMLPWYDQYKSPNDREWRIITDDAYAMIRSVGDLTAAAGRVLDGAVDIAFDNIRVRSIRPGTSGNGVYTSALVHFADEFTACCYSLGFTTGDIEDANQWKLVYKPNARYKDAVYTDAAAQARADKA